MDCFYCDPNHPDDIPAAFDPPVAPAERAAYARLETRRQFFGRAAKGFGAAALYLLMDGALGAAGTMAGRLPSFAPRAKRAIYLVMSGGPSQVDMFDYKPGLKFDSDLPASARGAE